MCSSPKFAAVITAGVVWLSPCNFSRISFHAIRAGLSFILNGWNSASITGFSIMRTDQIAASGTRAARTLAAPFLIEEGTQSRALPRDRFPANCTATGANPNNITKAPTSIPKATRLPSSASPGRELKFRLRKTAAVVTAAQAIPGPTALRSVLGDPGLPRASR